PDWLRRPGDIARRSGYQWWPGRRATSSRAESPVEQGRGRVRTSQTHGHRPAPHFTGATMPPLTAATTGQRRLRAPVTSSGQAQGCSVEEVLQPAPPPAANVTAAVVVLGRRSGRCRTEEVPAGLRM